ncbi:unnamed protein product [[Candida] boidinii]|nr:unnamed protein product [[Candida] boidinii]
MNFKLPQPNSGILFGGDITKTDLGVIANNLKELNYKYYSASEKVAQYLNEKLNDSSIKVEVIEFPKDNKRELREVFQKYDIQCVFNLASQRADSLLDEDYVMRRNAIDFAIPLFNEPNTSVLFSQCLKEKLPTKLINEKSDKVIIPNEVHRWSEFIGGKPV